MIKKTSLLFLFLILSSELFSQTIKKDSPTEKPIDIIERLGSYVPLDTNFINERGEKVSLESLFSKGIPTILTLNYFECPMLCTLILNGLSDLNFDKISSRAMADEKLSNWVDDASTRQFLLKNLYWKKPGELGLRINIEVLKNSSESIGEGLDKDVKSNKPCLFLKGQNSDYITDNDHSIIRYHFPSASHSMITKSGHWLHAENPEEFFRVTLAWLKKTSFL